jgi:DNA-binding response OmpR family regulator
MTGKRRVLIADDSEDVLHSLRALLESQYEVVTATSGFDALMLLHRGKFDGLIVDVTFPGGMSGLEIASAVRSLDPVLKIIVMSAVDYSDETRQRAVELGASFFEKPLDKGNIERGLNF